MNALPTERSVTRIGVEPRKKNRLWLHRERWRGASGHNPDSGGRYAIRLESWGPGPKGWYIGVLAPTKGERLPTEEAIGRRDHFASLTNAFSRGRSSREDWWPWWEDLEKRFDDWNSLLPELQEECAGPEDGRITKYVADRFIEIALAAIPKIDDIEQRTR